MSIKCFLPCRKGSERVPYKNTRPFAGYCQGLLELKLNQLLAVAEIETVVLSTNDEEILGFGEGLNHPKLQLHKRIDSLALSCTSTDQLISHALNLIPDSHILWTHVTSPFITSKDYQSIIEAYLSCLESGYDSLMTTHKIQGFLWDENKPINYDRALEKWPRTQTIKPIYEVNSGVFLSHASNYQQFSDRIGNKPKLYTLDKIKSFDIDWLDDFAIAECIAKSGLVNL